MALSDMTCSKCSGVLDGKHKSYCKSCYAAYTKARRNASPEARQAARDAVVKWEKANPEQWKRIKRFWQFRKEYGCTDEQATDILDRNDAGELRCEICLTPGKLGQGKKLLCVDHCHERNIFRGVLCGECNRMLGQALDDQFVLSQAITYLRKKGSPKRGFQLVEKEIV